MDATLYTAEISPEMASRFLLKSGIGLPARRATCLLELQLHVIRLYGQGAPQRVEQINESLYGTVSEWYCWASATGQRIVRFAGV